MTSLKLFDWSLQPLVEFANGTQQQNVSLDGTGHKEITIKSTGKLNSFANTELTMLSIAIVDESSQQKKDQGFINLVSTPLYKQLAGQYVEFLADDAPPIDTAYLNNPYQKASFAQNMGKNMVNAVISPAYAFSFMDVGSKLWEVINWIVPFEDVGILGQQIYYLATGDDRFDPVELALSTLGTLSIIPLPPTKALKVVVGSLRKGLGFMKRINPKFLKAFASVIGRIGQRAFKPVGKYIKANMSIRGLWRLKKNGISGVLDRINIDPFIEAAPFVIIIGEMLLTEEGRTALITLIKSIESDDDLFAWINYLSLPSDGWDSATPPVAKVAYNPPVEELNWANSIAKNTLGVLVPEAHASVRQAGLRVSAEILTKTMRTLKGVPKKARITSIKKIHRAFDGIRSKAYTKLAHTRQMALFATAKGVSSKTIRALHRKMSKMRISPIIVMTAVAYLESRKYCENEKDDIGLKCIPHKKAVEDKLDKLYASAFTDILLDESKFDSTFSRENGNLFHIVMLALKHLEYEQGVGLQVFDIEHPIQPYIYNTKTGGGETEKYSHIVDIMLGDTYVRNDGRNGIAVELKSYQARSLSAGTAKWKRGASFRINKDGETVKRKQPNSHKQFYLDRVALHKKDIADFQWWYQSFDARKLKGKVVNQYNYGPSKQQINTIARPRLSKLPLPKGGAKFTLGTSAKLGLIMQNKIDRADIKTLVIHESGTFFKGIATETIKEFVTDLY